MTSRIVCISDVLTSQRLDVTFHNDGQFLHGYVPLSNYVSIYGGKRLPKGETFSSEKTSYLYLRLADVVDLDNIDYTKLPSISETIFNTLKKYEIVEGEVSISIAGTIGKIFITKNIPIGKRVILTENCAVIRPKAKSLSHVFLKLLLNCTFVQQQIKRNSIQTTIPKIGLDRIGKLRIPVIPPIHIQENIINIYTKAQEAKQAKDEEAKSLLDNIDPYLLEVLDIVSNQQHEKKSKFSTSVSNLIGRRLDVSSCKEHFEMLSNKYPNSKLSSMVEIDPAIKFVGFNDDATISFIPMECIDEKYGEISERREIPISQIKGYTKFEVGDLLWAKITPCMQNGKSAIARNLKNGVGCGSTEYYVIRPKTEDLLIDYVYLILRHSEVLKAAQGSFGGSAGQQRVSNQ
jgi:type I restriction enzyme S subunit